MGELGWCEKGHFNLDQKEYVSELVKNHQPKYALETGFCTGRSTYSVLSSADRLEKMVSVDINFDYMAPHGRQMRSLLTRNYPKLTTFESDSKKLFTTDFFATNFPHGIDWFTVDGDHSYEGCIHDLEKVLPYMNPGGVIIIDDYKSGPPNGCVLVAVTKACDDFANRHPELKKTEWNSKGKGFCVFVKS